MSIFQPTPLEHIKPIYDELRQSHKLGKLKSIPFRKHQLLQLAYLVRDNTARFEAALATDLGRPALETQFLETGATISEAKAAYESVDKWAKPERPPFRLDTAALRPLVRKEAKGVVLIIAPFNFPLFCSVGPAIGAIAAGNCVLLKPSEKSAATSALLSELVLKYMDPHVIRVVNGGVPETTKLLELQWDHIMYTGSSKVGKIVAAAAAKHLTPVSLELGGKSPVIVDPHCDFEVAARRILWGKLANAGQVCVAPDYVLVPKDAQDALVDALKAQLGHFYPVSQPANSEGSFSRLNTPAAFSRVVTLLKNSKGVVVAGGETDESNKYIAPTIVRDVNGDDSLMSEEIFGPILPVVPVENLDEAIAFVNARDHPLALYVFSQDASFKNKVFDNTTSGAAVANETIIHSGMHGLPFGGIGPSGSGYYTGKYGFDTFTYLRASVDSPGWIDLVLGVRYPPYTDKNKNFLRKFFTPRLPPRPSAIPPLVTKKNWWGRRFILGLILAVSVVLIRKPLLALRTI